MKTNKKSKSKKENRLAGGFGPYAAKLSPELQLRRSVLTCLLGEDLAYEDGVSVADNIAKLIPKVSPETCYDIALESKIKQKLRHVPLFIAKEMAKYSEHCKLLKNLVYNVIQRPDDITELLSLYWKDGKKPIPNQMKKGLAESFHKFDEYQFAKYNRRNEIKLRDVMFLTHPNPKGNKEKEILFKKIANNELRTPDIWEVAFSRGADKKETWERLIKERKLGASAFLKNLKNITNVGVNKQLISDYFNVINTKWLLPIDCFKAYCKCEEWKKELENLMFRLVENYPKLKGYTIFVIDVSGSMRARLSDRSNFNRLDVAATLAVLVREICEHSVIYATSGNDNKRQHKTTIIDSSLKGFDLSNTIIKYSKELGNGGIFTRQCLEYIKKEEIQAQRANPDRIFVLSDSQDCDYPHKRKPNPFGKRNYIVDISSHKNGICYNEIWDAEILGWSEKIINFIYEYETFNKEILNE